MLLQGPTALFSNFKQYKTSVTDSFYLKITLKKQLCLNVYIPKDFLETYLPLFEFQDYSTSQWNKNNVTKIADQKCFNMSSMTLKIKVTVFK